MTSELRLFPKWTNAIPRMVIMSAGVGGVALAVGTWYWATPDYMEVGYRPLQPIAFSHQTHAGTLGIDCRYCHTHIEQSQEANVPTTTTCMNCHTVAGQLSGYLAKAVSPDGQAPSPHWESPDLQVLRAAHTIGEPVPWRRVHKLPDYVNFNHSIHLHAGVSCYSCHRRIDTMPVVTQAQGLGMGWCLDCHRAPEKNLVDTTQVDVTNLREVQKRLSDPQHTQSVGERLAASLRSAPPQDCGACHY